MAQTIMQISPCSRPLSGILRGQANLYNIKDGTFGFIDRIVQGKFSKRLNLKNATAGIVCSLIKLILTYHNLIVLI